MRVRWSFVVGILVALLSATSLIGTQSAPQALVVAGDVATSLSLTIEQLKT